MMNESLLSMDPLELQSQGKLTNEMLNITLPLGLESVAFISIKIMCFGINLVQQH